MPGKEREYGDEVEVDLSSENESGSESDSTSAVLSPTSAASIAATLINPQTLAVQLL